MAKNPVWANDERILVLDLYLDYGQLDASDPRVIEASEVLNQLPIHTVRPDLERFRNPNGVALKLANFRSIDPDDPAAGMSGGGQGDREVWDRFRGRREDVKRLASALRAGVAQPNIFPAEPVEDEEGVEEGRLVFRLHRKRERDRGLVPRKKQEAISARGKLDCEVCGFDFATTYGPLGDGFAEIHHVVPLSESGTTRTRLADLAVVCSNCHRMAHRRRPWASIPDLRAILVRSSGSVRA